MNQRIKKFILFFIIFNILLAFSSVCFAGTESSDINAIDDNLYPGVKAKIQAVKNVHPSWNIKVEYTDLDWNEVINGEHQAHGAANNPTNLVTSSSSNYGGLWICEICGKEKCDSGYWYCASTQAIEYMMDVRNSINETDIFQFMQLSTSSDSNNDTVRDILKRMAASTSYIDNECVEAIITAANTYHVDPYYIMAKIIGEQGTKTTTLIAGNGYNGQYVGVYNFFNIGATGSDGTSATVIRNGLAYAASQGWTSKTKAIVDGTRIISQSYIAKEQDTLYYQKFNVVGSNLYNHQYQQNILGAQNEGTSLRKIYLKMDSNLSGNYTFVIPLYKNMPSTPASRPSTTSSHVIFSQVMGDLNGDGQINILDVVIMINHLKGTQKLSGDYLEAAKVTVNLDVTITDVVLLINYLKGTAVLPSGGYQTASITSDGTEVKLSKGGTTYKTLNNGTSIKVISKASMDINGIYWDLIVSSNGVYGYINRNNWK